MLSKNGQVASAKVATKGLFKEKIGTMKTHSK
jgi:hypothetical protein